MVRKQRRRRAHGLERRHGHAGCEPGRVGEAGVHVVGAVSGQGGRTVVRRKAETEVGVVNWTHGDEIHHDD